MRRREFLGLMMPVGAAGARPEARRQEAAADVWRCEVHRDLRWSVGRRGAVPVSGADITVELDGAAHRLAALSDVRRIRTGDRETGVWIVVARAGDVEITAEFVDGMRPTVTVKVRGLGERHAVGRITLLETPRASVPALRGARVWINGRTGEEPCDVIAGGAGEGIGYWQVAMEEGGQAGGRAGGREGLGLSFGADDSGEGTFRFAGRSFAAVCDCRGRPVAAELPPAVCRLTVLPGRDPLANLGRLAGALLTRPPDAPPASWMLDTGLTESDLVANLEAAQRGFGPRGLRAIVVGDGYQRACGDWETNDRFPSGHRAITERIHAAGFQAGLWMAPFAAAERSGIPAVHPDWLLRTAAGAPLEVANRAAWGGATFALDAEAEGAREHLRLLVRNAIDLWGYDGVVLDHLEFGARGVRTGSRLSPAEACRAGIRALREGAARGFVVGANAPLQPAAGLVDGLRLAHADAPVRSQVHGIASRAHYQGRVWHAQLEGGLAGADRDIEVGRAWATLAAVTGCVPAFTDRLERLSAQRAAVLQRAMPALDVRLAAGTVRSAGDAGPATWLVSRAGDDWWMLAAFNWADDSVRLRTTLGAHGLRGPCASYDVWRETRGPDVTDAVSLLVPAQGSVCLALRRPRRTPFVLGSTRHVVQGLLDLERESWDARRRVLSGRSIALDRQPYAITIAVPPGLHPRGCTASVGCSAEHPHGRGPAGARAMRLTFSEVAETLEWEVAF